MVALGELSSVGTKESYVVHVALLDCLIADPDVTRQADLPK